MKLLVLALSLFATQAIAQEIEPLSVYPTRLYCYNPVDVFGVSVDLGERALFTGYSAVDSVNPESQEYMTLEGPMMFLVNQDSGTWLMGMMNPLGQFCSIAVGAEFEPYSE